MKNQYRPWSLLALVRIVLADTTLPYNPARILTTPNSTNAYIFRSSPDATNQALLEVVDFQQQLTARDLNATTISASLPFLKDDVLVPYIPILDNSGYFTVVLGSCSGSAQSTELWRLATGDASSGTDATWTKAQTSVAQLSTTSGATGVNYLSDGLAFSPTVNNVSAELDYYTFGGMCPFENSSATTWQNAADYSNTMFAFTSAASDGAAERAYSISEVTSRGPPIPEAGFSITGLTPTFRMGATGAAQTQQQDFLFFGGHTQDAFLNTSQVALFSLPQDSWSFLQVHQPQTGREELAVRQADTVIEPRSGHTAVLSEDGTMIIVLGGWVGDVTNPATPQLAVLHLGSEYGGDDAEAWTWSVPSESGSGIPAGAGIYGHGAAMLPGGVMMVVGGFQIPTTSSPRVKRQSQDGVLLYNTTSNAWIDSYTNPNYVAESEGQASSTGPLSKTSQQAGLGIGLGIAALVLGALIIFSFFYSKALKRRRTERERELALGSSDVSVNGVEQPFLDHSSIDGRGGDTYAGNYQQPMTQQVGSSGLFVNIPSPNRGLRKGLAGRPYSYHVAPRYDDGRLVGGSGGIHPIMEQQDEDEDPFRDPQEPQHTYSGLSNAEAKIKELQRVLESGTGGLSRASTPSRDPFVDPAPNPLGSHPTSPVVPGSNDTARRLFGSRAESPTRRPISAEADGSMNWQIVEHHDDEEHPMMGGSSTASSSNGRSSPTKTDDRTSSTLSDRSHRSTASTNSITRTMSTRTGAMMAAALARREADNTAATTPMEALRSNTMTTSASSSGRKSPYYFQNAPGTIRKDTKRNVRVVEPTQDSTESFTTANTSFAELQSQGATLLGGQPVLDRDDPYQRAQAAHGHAIGNPKPRPIPLGGGRQGWLGSVRRALTAISNERSFSLTSQSKQPASPGGENIPPPNSSTTPIRLGKPTPRRTVSDGGALLRQKRGQKDWTDTIARNLDDPENDWGEPASPHDPDMENEWDVEGEASKRDVQVTFTVPKARLRVVNADVERASMRSASDGAVSRKASMASMASLTLSQTGGIKRGDSVNTMRSRSDGEGGGQKRGLPEVAEESGGAVSSAVQRFEALGWDR